MIVFIFNKKYYRYNLMFSLNYFIATLPSSQCPQRILTKSTNWFQVYIVKYTCLTFVWIPYKVTSTVLGSIFL